MIKRKETRQVKLGKIKIGGGAPISVQSMTNTDTTDIETTINQITALEKVGCDIIRVAVPNMEAANALEEIKKAISLPLIADIHFDYRLALKALDAGVDGLRINPGNIGSKKKIKELVKSAGTMSTPIRIGVNAGSLEKDILLRHKHPTPEAMVESAMRHIEILEELDFHDIKVSLKASDVLKTVEAYKLLSTMVDYPMHIGITEAGTLFSGTIKSSIGLGILLAEGIGDTMRVSLTGDPVEEVRAAWEILKALKIRKRGINIISCPTCGRVKINIIKMAKEIEQKLSHVTSEINIALMGCVVNGPGEAIESDIGIAGGDGAGFLYIKGKKSRKIKESEIVATVVSEAERMVSSSGG